MFTPNPPSGYLARLSTGANRPPLGHHVLPDKYIFFRLLKNVELVRHNPHIKSVIEGLPVNSNIPSHLKAYE